MSLLAITLSSYAYTGNLTFLHGNNSANHSVGGSISSTAVEDSMRIDVLVRYDSDAAPSIAYPGNTEYNTDYIEHYVSVGDGRGYSYCYYIVDGENVASSKEWFPYDFR